MRDSMNGHVSRRTFVATAGAAAALIAKRAEAQPAPIKIGVVFSYSGSGPTGLTFDPGINLWMSQHGDRIAGRKVELIRRDDTGIAPDTAKRLAQELIVENNVDLLAGVAFTPNAIAVSQVSTQAKKPFFLVNAATSNIMEKAPYMSRWSFTTAQLVTPLAKWAVKNGITSAYSIVQDYGPGIDAGNAFTKQFADSGGKVTGAARFPVTTQDFSPFLERARDTKPQAVFVFVNASTGGAAFLKAFRDVGLSREGVKLIGTGDLVSENNLPSDGDLAIGTITAFHYSGTHNSALNRQIVSSVERLTHRTLTADFTTVQIYDVMHAIYNVVAAQHGQVDPERTMELVKQQKFESARGPIAIDPATRDIIENVYIRRTEKKNGKLVNTEFDVAPMQKDPNEHYSS
jgi:branched-chain amino acid transport system substrate-binding protein